MKHSILIIDDEAIGANNLLRAFESLRPQYNVHSASTEEEIEDKIENLYYNVAIVDLRMDKYKFNGFDLIKNIVETNPFARIIIMSAFLPDFTQDLQSILTTGKIQAIVEKTDFDQFRDKIFEATDSIVENFEANVHINQKALETMYSDAKNETNTYTKGTKFEQFVSILFAQMGFKYIVKRVKDVSLNEVDLIVRNELTDGFFEKFGPYILIECKNTSNKVDKNQFIQFRSKLEYTNGLSNLGVIITSSAITRNTYIEAVRSSDKPYKVIFISNIEINKLIYAMDMLNCFKSIIDEQIKDN